MVQELRDIFTIASRRLCLFAIFFTAVGMSIETLVYYNNQNTYLIWVDGLTAIIEIVNVLLLWFRKHSLRKATLLLNYPIFLNTVAVYYEFVNFENADKLILRDMLLAFLLIFVAAFIVGKRHAIALSLMYIVFFLGATFMIKSDFLYENIPTISIIFIGGCFTLIVFAEILKKTYQNYLKSQNKVEALNAYKKNLMRLIIHDLKVPVSSILELSRNRESTVASKIYQNADNLKHQINNILDIEKLEDTGIELSISSIDVERLITKAISFVEVLALNKSITISTQFNTTGYLRCDNDLIIRVLVNLLSNAIKFSKINSKVKIVVNEENQACEIVVVDFGKGIAFEHQHKVFDKFFHIRQNNFSDGSSTGLGLTFCKLAMEAHKGSIGLESEFGLGTEFKLLFPDFIKNERSIQNNKHSFGEILLTKVEIGELLSVCESIKKIEIYKMSAIALIVSPLKSNKSKNIRDWSERVLLAVYTGDEELYDLLLKKVVYE